MKKILNRQSILILTFIPWPMSHGMNPQENFLNGSFSVRRHDQNSIRIFNISPKTILISSSTNSPVLMNPNSSFIIPAAPGYNGCRELLPLSIAGTNVRVLLGDTVTINSTKNNPNLLSIIKEQYHHKQLY